jgi:hypothetical protein
MSSNPTKKNNSIDLTSCIEETDYDVIIKIKRVASYLVRTVSGSAFMY